MADNLKRRLDELAKECTSHFDLFAEDEPYIRNLLTEAVRAALAEPSDEMMVRGSWESDVAMGPLRKAWDAMVSEKLKELE